MKLFKKLKSKAGFTMLESMLALMIISVLTIGITVGVNAAWDVYKRSLFISEGDILAATLDMALADILRYSIIPEVVPGEDPEIGGPLKFTNLNYGVVKGHFLLKDGFLALNQTDEKPDNATDAPLVAVVSGGTYTSMKLDSFSISYNAGIFTGKYVIVSKENEALRKEFDFCVRSLNGV